MSLHTCRVEPTYHTHPVNTEVRRSIATHTPDFEPIDAICLHFAIQNLLDFPVITIVVDLESSYEIQVCLPVAVGIVSHGTWQITSQEHRDHISGTRTRHGHGTQLSQFTNKLQTSKQAFAESPRGYRSPAECREGVPIPTWQLDGRPRHCEHAFRQTSHGILTSRAPRGN
jgi:hypothetical protein